MVTHEAFIQAVANLAIGQVRDPEAESLLRSIKLVYGSGPSGTRGVTYYKRWTCPHDHSEPQPFVEVCAFGQESWVQVAGTTIHELGHVLAGWDAAHGKLWKAACARLGLRHCKAAGTAYRLACFAPQLRLALAALPKPNDGEPVTALVGAGAITLKPCGAGVGTRGGRSRGKGSGSRLRLWLCGCEPPVRVRVAGTAFAAHCDYCSEPFCQG